MSADVVALVRDRPDLDSVLAELGPGLRAEDRRVLDHSGRLAVVVSMPALISAPGEVERLLGLRPPVPPPLWWIDIRAAADLTDAPRIARRCAELLAARYRGGVWPRAPR